MNSGMSEMALVSPFNTEPIELLRQGSTWKQRGSLPFKKRRLYHAIPVGDGRGYSWIHNLQSKTPRLSDVTELSIAGSSDEKIAALALMASVGGAVPLTTSLHGLDASSSGDDRSSSTHSIQDESETGNASPQSPGFSGRVPVSPDEADQDKGSNGSGSARQRVHHPPLSAPLPNGCHGRTSRNNSYCRRQPCYNGSKYCKLHYQQYIVAGMRAPADIVKVESSPSALVETGSRCTTPPPTAHQDKRFTGCDDEVRCLATTTRGRACAYVAVKDTKYCYLHADYDTNPPPRRGGCSGSPQKLKALLEACPIESLVASDTPSSLSDAANNLRMVARQQQLEQRHGLRGAEPADVIDTASSSRDNSLLCTIGASIPSNTSEESGATAPWLTPTAKDHTEGDCGSDLNATSSQEIEQTPSDGTISSPYPLLSSISSDQWFNKLVMISTGPLVNQTGRVMKWGNGWVAVRISTGTGQGVDGLLHNRRSIELYLLPDEHEFETCRVESSFDDAGDESGLLRRCVSRDTDAPATPGVANTLTDHDTRGVVQPTPFAKATPVEGYVVACRVGGRGSGPRGYDVSNEGGNCWVDQVEDTQDALEQHAIAQGEHDVSVSVPRDRVMYDAAPATSDGDLSHCSPKSSESSDRVKHVPYRESFLLAQEGYGRKYNLDLLFGTAALERSRRTVHKPKRYEDTAMLDKGRTKNSESDVESTASVSSKIPLSCVSPKILRKSPPDDDVP